MSSTVIIIIILIVILAVLGYFVGIYNSLIKFRVLVDEGFSTMDVYLTKRYDLIPNLVETVKGYAAHEKDTLEKVIQARNMAMNAGNAKDALEGNNMLTGALKSLFAISEAYPDLKANQNFIDLQEQLKKVEEDIANARSYYNAVVRDYNTAIAVFPKNIIANMFHFTARPMYEVTTPDKRENVNIKF